MQKKFVIHCQWSLFLETSQFIASFIRIILDMIKLVISIFGEDSLKNISLELKWTVHAATTQERAGHQMQYVTMVLFRNYCGLTMLLLMFQILLMTLMLLPPQTLVDVLMKLSIKKVTIVTIQLCQLLKSTLPLRKETETIVRTKLLLQCWQILTQKLRHWRC